MKISRLILVFFILFISGKSQAEMPEEPSIETLANSSEIIAVGYYLSEESFNSSTNYDYRCIKFRIIDVLKGAMTFEHCDMDPDSKGQIGVIVQTRRPWSCYLVPCYKKGPKYILFLDKPIFGIFGNLYMRSEKDRDWPEREATDKIVLRIRKLLNPLKMDSSSAITSSSLKSKDAKNNRLSAEEETTTTLSVDDLAIVDLIACKYSRSNNTGQFAVIMPEKVRGKAKSCFSYPSFKTTNTLTTALIDRNRMLFSLPRPIVRGATTIIGDKMAESIIGHKGWDKTFPNSKGYETMWLPGYGESNTKALVYVWNNGFGDGLSGSGELIRLKKMEGKWSIDRIDSCWVE